MLSGVPSAREHLAQRADVRDRTPSMTYSEPRGQHGDVTGQYRERYYPEVTSREPFRGPVTTRYNDSTQTTPQGLMMPPWNKLPGQSIAFYCQAVHIEQSGHVLFYRCFFHTAVPLVHTNYYRPKFR